MEYETITATDAIYRMRNLRLVNGATFMLIHITCDLTKRTCGEISKHEHCRLRSALKENTFKIDGDHYLPFEDTDTGEPKMCFKKLIRFVAFPPEYKILKVSWFDE
jgi:hypothetical protein